METKSGTTKPQKSPPSREERLKSALKENMRRRKTQAKVRKNLDQNKS